MNDYKTLLNSNIKKLRKEFNLSRDEFAEKVGVSTDTICNLENNRYAPKPETIDKICESFNITPLFLLKPNLSSNKKQVLDVIGLELEHFDVEDLYLIEDFLKLYKKIINNKIR